LDDPPSMPEKIKVLYVIGTLEVGGTEGQLVRLATGLDRERFEPSVICLSTAGPYREPLEAAGIRVEVAGFRGFTIFRNPRQVAIQLMHLYRFMRRVKPTIVHGFLFWAYVIGAYVAWCARVPIFISSRRSLGYHKTRMNYRAMEWVANRVTRLVVANSEAVRQDSIRQEGLRPEMTRVIYNGLDPARFASAASTHIRTSIQVPAGATLIAVISNFIHYKGHATFLEAWAVVVRRHPKVIALLVGEGPTRVGYEATVQSMDLGSNIRFLGSRQDVPDILATVDALVHPSDEEGFSNAILEAMAAGKPVVATAVGGNPEAVVEGETGYLFPIRDVGAMAEAILRLLDDPESACAFGRAGRQRVEELFTEDRMIAHYESLYAALAADVRMPVAATGPLDTT
jgi:glycosyltransferase involved in cell wall biosynthesis